MTVVDASIVVRLLQNRREDAALRARFEQHRHVHAPTLIDAEVASATRGLLMTSEAAVTITADRASQMLDDFADLPLYRYPMQPHQRRVLTLRNNFTAHDAFYIDLAESLGMPLLTTIEGLPKHQATRSTSIPGRKRLVPPLRPGQVFANLDTETTPTATDDLRRCMSCQLLAASRPDSKFGVTRWHQTSSLDRETGLSVTLRSLMDSSPRLQLAYVKNSDNHAQTGGRWRSGHGASQIDAPCSTGSDAQPEVAGLA